MLKCEKCGFENPEGLARCHSCGTSLHKSTRTVQNIQLDSRGATIVKVDDAHNERLPAQLKVKTGRFAGKVYALQENQTLGREKCEIILRDPHISRQHAAIKFVGGDYLIVDLGSSNHTFVNDQMIRQPTVLQNGDLISIGNTALEFQIEEEEI